MFPEPLSSGMHAIAAESLGNSLAALVAGFGTAGVTRLDGVVRPVCRNGGIRHIDVCEKS